MEDETGLGKGAPSPAKQKPAGPGCETLGQPARQHRQLGPVARIINLEDYFSSASMILLKVADGRMTAEVFSSSGQ